MLHTCQLLKPAQAVRQTCPQDSVFALECGYTVADDGEMTPAEPSHRRSLPNSERKLGDGGMGEVYLAHQEQMDRHVAIKLLNDELAENPSQVERFRREAQAASQLAHPNTIVVHDFGQR